MKNDLLYSIGLLLLLCTCKKAQAPSETKMLSEDTKNIIPKTAIDSYITNSIKAKNDFKWAYASDVMVWSALKQSDKVLSIGYKPANWTNTDVTAKMQTINIQSQQYQEVKARILQMVWEEERKSRPNLKIEELEVWPEKYLPVICVSAQNLSTIKKLRQSQLVRYVEPIGYQYGTAAQNNGGNELQSGLNFGCVGAAPYTGNLIPVIDYDVVSPLAKASWNFKHHNIQSGWKVSSGKGVKVMVVDTGCSFQQKNLNDGFNQGESFGRTIEHLVTLPKTTSFFGMFHGEDETPDDPCGHGTQMSGAVAGPRGTDGSACGVAYNCDLVTVRASHDVILDESREAQGVADAFNIAANRDDIKIISMSMGYPFYISQVADAIKNATDRGKLVFCAAGTTTRWTNWGWVAFPANMPIVNAVTGVQDNQNVRCDVCHEGPEVDFVVVMEKNLNKLEALSLSMSGHTPSVVGGSSIATASMTGMAAMVWSKFPNKSASEILDILKASSVNPDNNPNWGAGFLKVDQALGISGGPRHNSQPVAHTW